MHRCLTFLDKEPGHVHLFKGLDSKPIPTSRSSRFLRYVSMFDFWGVAAYGKGRTVCYEHHA